MAQSPAARAPAVGVPTVPATGSGLWILDVGKNKISVIRVLREHLHIGLREAKDLADSTPPIRISLEGSRVGNALEELRNAGADARLLLP
jgi:large subunit ribosomal protein L7/L12